MATPLAAVPLELEANLDYSQQTDEFRTFLNDLYRSRHHRGHVTHPVIGVLIDEQGRLVILAEIFDLASFRVGSHVESGSIENWTQGNQMDCFAVRSAKPANAHVIKKSQLFCAEPHCAHNRGAAPILSAHAEISARLVALGPIGES